MVSIVIPNYNGERFLKDCLEALRRQTYEDMEVILVDNASTDNSVELAQKLYPGIRVVELDDNTGFAYAVNRGIEAAEGEYVLLLNNDTIVFPNFVKKGLCLFLTSSNRKDTSLTCLSCFPANFASKGGKRQVDGERHISPLARHTGKTAARRNIFAA